MPKSLSKLSSSLPGLALLSRRGQSLGQESKSQDQGADKPLTDRQQRLLQAAEEAIAGMGSDKQMLSFLPLPLPMVRQILFTVVRQLTDEQIADYVLMLEAKGQWVLNGDND